MKSMLQYKKSGCFWMGLCVVGVMATGCGLPPEMTDSPTQSSWGQTRQAQTVKLLYSETSADQYVKLDFTAPADSTTVGSVVETDWTVSLQNTTRQKTVQNDILEGCTAQGRLVNEEVIVTRVIYNSGQHVRLKNKKGVDSAYVNISYQNDFRITKQTPFGSADLQKVFSDLHVWYCNSQGKDSPLTLTVEYKYLEQAYICADNGSSVAVGKPTWKNGSVSITWQHACQNPETLESPTSPKIISPSKIEASPSQE